MTKHLFHWCDQCGKKKVMYNYDKRRFFCTVCDANYSAKELSKIEGRVYRPYKCPYKK